MLEIGLKLERIPGSRLGFFKSGVTRSVLYDDGKVPSVKDKFASRVIVAGKDLLQDIML